MPDDRPIPASPKPSDDHEGQQPLFPFDNSCLALPPRFWQALEPQPVKAPQLLALNRPLAVELGLDADRLASPEGVEALAGNTVPDGAAFVALAYAGHQFGNFVPSLGDGRAVLLGEVIDQKGRRRDIQLKGSGPTPFSRGGDGRAPLGPVLREYIVAEAMHALGIPTTRALAALATGERVVRQRLEPGGVLVRVAASHLRVGTFEYFAARGDGEAVQTLTEYAIARHTPQAADALDFLGHVVEAQADLVARWMAVGFVHGVMNTDNTAISGETIDYGPCAFLDTYHPGAVFSSIDTMGRYAYARQPQIAAWNLARLAACLLPLIDADEDKAVRRAEEVVNGFFPLFQRRWLTLFRAKLGLVGEEAEDGALITDLLTRMSRGEADFTRTFRNLAHGTAAAEFADPALFEDWAQNWRARLARNPAGTDAEALMLATNPRIIARNHRIKEALDAAEAGDMAPFERLAGALAAPFAEDAATADLEAAPRPEERVWRTFCGT